VFSAVICVNCRQLIAVVFLSTKYLNILNIIVKICNVKMVVEVIKLYKLSRCRTALNCSCVLSLIIFGGAPCFPVLV
jgi:hypothetical protein